MSTFQGFNITGIDRNKCPVFTDDNDLMYNVFYLTLEPIGADADYENQRLWNYSFRREVENWTDTEDVKRLQQLGISAPDLTVIFDPDDNACICVPGPPFNNLAGCLSHIKGLVERVNNRFISEVETVNHFRAGIDRINSTHFRN